jgi:hypothetical protein
MFVFRTMFYQITSRITVFVIGRAYEAMTGEELNVSAYIMNTLRFYWDWAAGMSGFALHSIKWITLGLTMLLDQLLVWLGRQITMVTEAMHDRRLQYDDLNAVQF